MNRVNPQFIFARGEDGGHYAVGELEMFTYSTYNGPEAPGDQVRPGAALQDRRGMGQENASDLDE
jgi:hypothetical protein